MNAMRIQITLGIAVLLAWTATVFVANADERNAFIESVQIGVFDAEVLRLRSDDATEEVARRFTTAMQEKSEWFQEYVRKNRDAKGGLPYHRNFGIRQEEYTRLQTAPKSLRPHSKVRIEFAKSGTQSIDLTASGDAKLLTGMRFDAKENRVTWREFSTSDCKFTNPNPKAIAHVSGVSWTMVATEPKEEMSRFYVSLGRFVESEHGFLNVIVTDFDRGKIRLQIDLTLRWPTK